MLTYRNNQEWRTRAACRGTDPDLWESPTCLRADGLDRADQRKICESCPVLRECAADSALSKDVGVIRAGVPIALTGTTGRRRSWKALELIALNGDIEGSMQQAFEGYYANRPAGPSHE